MTAQENRNAEDTTRKNGERVTASALSALLEMLDQDRCGAWLFDLLHSGRTAKVCPFCGAEFGEKMGKTFRSFKKTRCNACGRQFTAVTNTPFFHCQMKAADIFLIAALVDLGVDAAGVALALGLDRGTARIWIDKLQGLKLADLARVETAPPGP